ncbi:MAG: sensor domain-containing protein [Streptosporangiaceae bacterium]
MVSRPGTARGLRPVAGVLAGPVSPRTWLLTAALAGSLLTGAFFFFAVVVALVVAGALSWVVAAGTIAAAAALRLGALLAGADRRRISRSYGLAIAPALLPSRQPGQPLIEAQRGWRHSPAAWRLAAYQVVRLPACAAAAFVVTVCWWTVIGLLFIVPLRRQPAAPAFTSWFFGHGILSTGAEVVAALVGFAVLLLIPPLIRALARLDAALGQRMLGPNRAEILAGEVDRLAQSRAQAIDAGDIERHRIERDLHDGVQPRLVSLAMQIDRARARLNRDPSAADELLRHAHADAKGAIADLRSIARGIHPAILDERGLDAALSALVAGSAVPVAVSVRLSRRPGRSQEAVAYFAAAEAIGNLAKHASASQAALRISDETGDLVVQVTDDGSGGAVVTPGGGLAGIAGRLAAVDGSLSLDSPPGGPTTVTAVIPCAS